jgi:hypothetical protein
MSVFFEREVNSPPEMVGGPVPKFRTRYLFNYLHEQMQRGLEAEDRIMATVGCVQN